MHNYARAIFYELSAENVSGLSIKDVWILFFDHWASTTIVHEVIQSRFID